MAKNVVIVLVIIVTSVSYLTAVSGDCALAGLPNKNVNTPKEIYARRDAEEEKKPETDKLDPAMKYKFGITYPYGVRPHSGYTIDEITLKTPPTNFFPMGSSVYTVTMYPIPHMYVNKKSDRDTCDFLNRACMKVYDTGYVCARALHGAKFTFDNYCAMKYANCSIKSDLWQMSYFGSCELTKIPDYGEDFDIEGENFLEAAVINQPPFNPLTGQQESMFRL